VVYIPGVPIVIISTSKNNWVADVHRATSCKVRRTWAVATLGPFVKKIALSVCTL
jgi:hypothetical protein